MYEGVEGVTNLAGFRYMKASHSRVKSDLSGGMKVASRPTPNKIKRRFYVLLLYCRAE